MGGELDFPWFWEQAVPYHQFVEGVQDLRGLWEGVYKKAAVPGAVLDDARRFGAGARFLAISEDWCWDAANTVPVLAKLCDTAGDMELRVISRDEYPDLMDHYLTNGTRSIPIVVVLDADLRELGHWGPRPAELQAWAKANKGEMEKKDFYAEMRRWHVKDGGQSMLREIVEILK